MKYLNTAIAGLLYLFAAFQFNDPDPWMWVLVYGTVATMYVLHLFGKMTAQAALSTTLVCLVFAAFFVPDIMTWINEGAPSIAGQMKAEAPHIELMRELGGLLICAAAAFFLYRQIKTAA